MRCTQIFGLKPEAVEWLDQHCKKTPIKKCKECGHQTGGQLISREYASAKDKGMFDDGPMLEEYETDEGIMREIVQIVTWSSGPCIFLCLEDKNKNRLFTWNEQEIENA